DAEGNITQVEENVNGIQQTVSNPVNGLVTQVSTLANGFNVLVKDFEDLEVGGRNLILGSSKPITLPPQNAGGVGDNYNYTRLKAPMKKGETYTLSFHLEITHGA